MAVLHCLSGHLISSALCRVLHITNIQWYHSTSRINAFVNSLWSSSLLASQKIFQKIENIVTICDIIQFTLHKVHKSAIIRKWLMKNVKIRVGFLLEQSVFSRKYIIFILQVILAVCIQCVITFFWHQERTFLFYTLSLYVSLSFPDDLSQLIFRNEKWCICFKQHGKWQIRVFSHARFRIIANHSLDNALVV